VTKHPLKKQSHPLKKRHPLKKPHPLSRARDEQRLQARRKKRLRGPGCAVGVLVLAILARIAFVD
jgi:hypothetical protein